MNKYRSIGSTDHLYAALGSYDFNRYMTGVATSYNPLYDLHDSDDLLTQIVRELPPKVKQTKIKLPVVKTQNKKRVNNIRPKISKAEKLDIKATKYEEFAAKHKEQIEQEILDMYISQVKGAYTYYNNARYDMFYLDITCNNSMTEARITLFFSRYTTNEYLEQIKRTIKNIPFNGRRSIIGRDIKNPPYWVAEYFFLSVGEACFGKRIPVMK
jgi:hypothetical protein